MMPRAAGFDLDQACRQLGEEWKQLPASNLPPNNYGAALVDSVNLKYRLHDVQTDRDRLTHALLHLCESLPLPRGESRPKHQQQT
jgi:hypothetical protein